MYCFTPGEILYNVAWANSNDDCMARLHKLQKKAIRIVFRSSFLAHTKRVKKSNVFLVE